MAVMRSSRRFAAAVLAGLLFSPTLCAQVYRWVDEEGITHLSSEKPPAGVKAERIDIAGTRQRSSSSSGAASSRANKAGASTASPAQVAEREALLGRLRTRECVIALEALERKTRATEATSAEEIRRLKQTADLNCSPDPSRRLEQERMAARLRVANGDACVAARNRLADMMEPGSDTPRDQLRAQQAYVDEHCISPVR